MKTFTALLALARLVGETYEGKNTGGSTTTLIDTNARSTADDYWNGGTIFMQSGFNVGISAIITDYANTSKTWTFAAMTQSNAASGQTYAVVRLTFPRQELIAAINSALNEIGMVTQHDDTLVITADTEEYDLPAGVSNVVRVEVSTSPTEPYAWKRTAYWNEEGGQLIFDPGKHPTSVDNLIRVHYNAPHAAVNLDADAISDSIWPERLAWTAAYYACLNRTRQVGKDDPSLKDLTALCAARMTEMQMRFPIRLMPRSTKGSGL